MSFAKFLVDAWRSRDAGYDGAHGLPIQAIEGHVYSEVTSDPASVEIDWDELQKQIEALEREFAANATTGHDAAASVQNSAVCQKCGRSHYDVNFCPDGFHLHNHPTNTDPRD